MAIPEVVLVLSGCALATWLLRKWADWSWEREVAQTKKIAEGKREGWSWAQMRNDDLKRIRLLMHEEDVVQRIADDHCGVHYEEPERLKVRK